MSPAYDSLVAKLMAHGQDRAPRRRPAVARALRALELDGLETNRRLLGAVLDDAAFRRGEADVHYLDSRPDLRDARLPDEVRHRHAAAAAFCLTAERAAAGAWSRSAPPAGATSAGRCTPISSRMPPGRWRCASPAPASRPQVLVDGEWRDVGHGDRPRDGWVVDLVTTDGLRRRYRVRLSAHRADVNGPEGQSSFALRAEDDPDERGGVAGECRAPLPGAVTKVLVAEGDTVAEGDGLVVLEAMKMEHTLRANGAGTVTAVTVRPGSRSTCNDLLVTVEPA